MPALWPEITSFANLCRAARRAARGKRGRVGAAAFLERLEPEALALQRRLLDGSWRPARPSRFVIHDPKERVITAAPFPDRVVHHALIDPLEAALDGALVPETFACRRGKGTHAALDHAQDLLRAHEWFLKLDVSKCFESIEHDVVLDTLRALELEPEVLELCARILAGSTGALGRGLPIGSLTSQWFANLVLGRVDRVALAIPGVLGYARYMDDFVLFGAGKAELKKAGGEIELFLRGELRLELKQRASVLAPVTQGLPFLGWRLHRGTRRIRRTSLRRLRQRVRRSLWEHREGRSTSGRLLQSIRSVTTHLATGDTLSLRREWLVPLQFELGGGSPAPTNG